MDPILFYILSIIFIATLVRSTFGFGESLIAVPLLGFLMPIETAVPLSVLISIVIAAVVVVQDRQKVHFYSAKWLLLSALLGIPIGLMLLVKGDESLVKTILGFLIILYSGFSLISVRKLKITGSEKPWLFLCGFLSGIFGGAYGLNGPPLVVYGNLHRWSAQHFRATLQAYFLPASLLGMAGYWYEGLWTFEVTEYFVISLPVVLPTIFLGRYLNQKISGDKFLKMIYFGLLAVGIALLWQ